MMKQSACLESFNEPVALKSKNDFRVLIVANNASMKWGGESSAAHYYFKLLRKKGIEAWLCAHIRCREELLAAFPEDKDRIYCVTGIRLQRWISRWRKHFPARIRELILATFSYLITQVRQRQYVKEIIRKKISFTKARFKIH